MLERCLIEHCAPTLASLKTASLFTITYPTQSDLLFQLRQWNLRLGQKGVTLRVIRDSGGSALIYVYRRRLAFCTDSGTMALKRSYSGGRLCINTG